MKSTLNKRYDLRGNEIGRLGKIIIFSKSVPVGNLRGGPGARCLATLTVLHYLGGMMYGIQARYGHKLQWIHPLIRKIRR